MTRSPLTRRTRLRPRARKRSTRFEDPVYQAWILKQDSIVGIEDVPEADMRDVVRVLFPGLVGVGFMRLMLSGVEGHHHKASDDHTLLPLLWWLHRETKISVHGGGGRRKFAQRFGIDWDGEIAKLRIQYESERRVA